MGPEGHSTGLPGRLDRPAPPLQRVDDLPMADPSSPLPSGALPRDVSSRDALLRGVLDAGFDPLTIVQAVRAPDGRLLDFRVLDANTPACAMIGRPRDHVLGELLDTLLPLGRSSGLWDQCATVVITGRPLVLTRAVPAASDPDRWVLRQLVPVPGEIVAISARDVTALQRERLALEESEERHRQLFEHNGAVQLLVEAATGRIQDANPAAEGFYGWPRETLRSMAMTDLEAITREQWIEGIADIEAGSGLRVHREHRVASGGYRQVDAHLGMVAIGSRRVLHLIIQDHTDRERVARHLQESEDRFQAVIHGMRDGVVVFDQSGAIVLHNPSAERILGLTGEQLRGVHPFDREWVALREDLTPWPVDEHPGFIALRTGQPQPRQQMALRHGAGVTTWLTVTADPLYRPGASRPYGAVGVFTDITSLKAYEERLRQTQALEAVAQLAGGVAHDYNNLLTVIRGATGFLRDGAGPQSPMLEDIAAIERATDQAEALTRRLLTVGRRQPLRPESVELNELLREELPAIRDELPLAIVVQLDLSPTPVLAAITRDRMREVLHALVANAAAAMADGGILVLGTSLAQHRSPARAPHAVDRDEAHRLPYAVLHVRDTGTGMPAAIRQQLTTPLVDRNHALPEEGRSLERIHAMIHQQDGFLACDAVPGEGTHLRLHLPLAGAPPL